MYTPTHLIFGMAAFGRPDAPKITAAAIAGAAIPDLSLYLLAGTHLLILGTDPQVVFGEMYFSDAWQSVFRIDNSFLVWGMVLALGLALRRAWIVALAGSALLHIGLDFPLHHDDGRAHFWPITNWIFESPVSYWDPAHFGRILTPIEVLVSWGVCAWLSQRYRGSAMRAVIGVFGLLQVPVAYAWVVGVGT
ncbi:cobalamin biosynthesis protein CobQ [Octadecabacter sp. G9-8]|uniref:Cobalamin biosynthesis protein CobQ n=1 Tax=Octadecabacter dasysiphoniae TaxID=2909341 RepID=A0ABS9CSJ8_9RHOB|nr:cobalamin biosynthesis protein CobQ [Octadecabacter dasysiphoniae]MCF2869921.1 cobalamin biosynthesis protein CobQ [Octadecabacter dasysiphoniae]